MSATPWIVGGVGLVVVGGALWWLHTRPVLPPTVKPGIAPGTNNTFGGICSSVYSAGYQGVGAAYGAPPTQTAGIAKAVANGTCSLLSTVGSYIGKGISAGAVELSRVAAPAATGIGKAQLALLTGGISLVPGSATAARAVAGQTSNATKAQLALSTGGLSLVPGASTVANKVGSTVGGIAHGIASLF